MSVLAALSRRLQSLTTDAKPDPPRVIIQGPVESDSNVSDLAGIKQKSAPVTPDPNRIGSVVPVVRRQSSTANPRSLNSEFSNNENLGFSENSKPQPRPRSPRSKTNNKPKGKPSQNPNVVNYNIVNSHRITIGPTNSFNCNINQYTGIPNPNSDGGIQKPKTKPMTKDVEELTSNKQVINLDDMFLVKTHIGNGWRDVARRLGYSEGQIQQFEENHKYVDQVVYQILLDWKQTNTKDAQVGVLVSNIWLSQEYDCAERLAASHKTSI